MTWSTYCWTWSTRRSLRWEKRRRKKMSETVKNDPIVVAVSSLPELFSHMKSGKCPFVWSRPFTHIAHNRRLSVSDTFSFTYWKKSIWFRLTGDAWVELAVFCLQHIKDGCEAWYILYIISMPTKLLWILQIVYLHMDTIGHYRDFALGSWKGKVWLLSSPTGSDICILTYNWSGVNV